MDKISPEKEYSNYSAHIRKVLEAEQAHVFRWWAEIDFSGKEHLLLQISSIDFDLLQRLYSKYLRKENHALQGVKKPPDVISVPVSQSEKERAQRAETVGKNVLRKGEIAILTVAGGQATRLGIDSPKGTLPVSPINKKSIFRLHAEKIYALQKKYTHSIPWYIMTSETNDKETRDFFASHNFFGLEPQQVIFFTQQMVPCIDLNGKLLMNSKSNIVMSPNGHGGTIIALKEKHILDDMKKRGIKHIFYHQVDNVLIKIADPVFVGYHIEKEAEMSLKVVEKYDPEEKVGVIVDVNGCLQMVEYSELSEEDRYKRNEDGSLLYKAGNIAIHMFRIDFLEKVHKERDPLPYHIAIKKVPFLNENGEFIYPKTKNAIKFETFIFDILKYLEKSVIMEVVRNEEFSPIKNAEGENSPATARQDMINLFGRWLQNAGVSIPFDYNNNVIGQIEISPCFALDEDEVGNKIDTDLKFKGVLNL